MFGTVIEMDVLSLTSKYPKPIAMILGPAAGTEDALALVLSDDEGVWHIGQIITIPHNADRDIKIIDHL